MDLLLVLLVSFLPQDYHPLGLYQRLACYAVVHACLAS
jgi:hypothetical protein